MLAWLQTVLYGLLALGAWLVVLRGFGAVNRWRTRRVLKAKQGTVTIAFFHPYCDDAGGGERVLWRAIHALSQHAVGKRLHVLIYTGGESPPSAPAILRKVKGVFGIDLIDAPNVVPITFVHVRWRPLLEPTWYSMFTILGQSIGALLLSCEALARATPDVFFDSTGWAFAFFPACAAGCRVAAYVHYPTVSADMLRRVRELQLQHVHKLQLQSQRSATGCRAWLGKSAAGAAAKVAYYRAYAVGYCAAGGLARVVMVNSQWTRAHVEAMWRRRDLAVVYPPCNTAALQAIPLDDSRRERLVLSVGQFRPEKDHALQISAFARLLKTHDDCRDVRLVLAGGCRNAGDAACVAALQRQCQQEGLSYTQRGAAYHGSSGSSGSSSNGGSNNLQETRSLVNADTEHVPDPSGSTGERGAGTDGMMATVTSVTSVAAVTFALNCSHAELAALLSRASVGLHTMWSEHFGIGVVEMMAAGVVTIAHNSGGPSTDIIVVTKDETAAPVGFLAATVEEYAEAMARVLRGGVDRAAVRAGGRAAAARFSDEAFDAAFVNALLPLL